MNQHITYDKVKTVSRLVILPRMFLSCQSPIEMWCLRRSMGNSLVIKGNGIESIVLWVSIYVIGLSQKIS